MCREGAWAELTVQVTSVDVIRSRMHGFKFFKKVYVLRRLFAYKGIFARGSDQMSYQALYRKWRPRTFDDVKGQDAIVRTLKNQIERNRIGHAYLFCGTRGTGKTSVAKIFARAVNCEHPVDGSPCGECAVCRGIQDGSLINNVVEIDAASNNGVENIRQIREEIAYSPAAGKYLVYIIDEVHMLSIGAFNALLKTLEEPPEYVIFILATTEAHKIPITILSRCQRYDFRRITTDTIAARLTELAEKEALDVEERALRYIARAADGSMRDALSLLDQCTAFYFNERLTYEHVLDILGAVDTSVFSHLLRYVMENDVTSALKLIEEIVRAGRELGQFASEFTWYLRNLMLAQSSNNLEDVLDISADNLKLLQEEAEMVSPQILLRYIRVFSELSGQMRYAVQKRVLLEVSVIKLCKPQMEQSYDAVLERLSQLEDRISRGVTAVAPMQEAALQPRAEVVDEPESVTLPPARKEDLLNVCRQWNSIIADLPTQFMRIQLRGTAVSVTADDTLVILVAGSDQEKYFNRNENENLLILQKSIQNRIGKEIRVVVKLTEENTMSQGEFVDPAKLAASLFAGKVTIVEEDD